MSWGTLSETLLRLAHCPVLAFHPSFTVSVVRPRSLPEATVPSLCLSWFSGCPLSLGWLVWCFLMLCLPQTIVCIPASVPTVLLIKVLYWPLKTPQEKWLMLCDYLNPLWGGDPWNMDLHLSSPSSSEFYHWSFQPHFLSFCRDSSVFFLPARLFVDSRIELLLQSHHLIACVRFHFCHHTCCLRFYRFLAALILKNKNIGSLFYNC